MKLKFSLLTLGGIIGLALTLAAWRYFSGPYTYHGSVINPPAPAADFQLTDQHGQAFQLAGQHGKVVLLFFGYTHCPDVCPVTLAQFKQIKDQLGSQANDVRFVFITIDPDRDTAGVMKDYLAKFDPVIFGLTGDQAALQEVWGKYGVYVSKDSSGNFSDALIDHTARIYAIDGQGNWRMTFPIGMETYDIVQDVSHLIRGG